MKCTEIINLKTPFYTRDGPVWKPCLNKAVIVFIENNFGAEGFHPRCVSHQYYAIDGVIKSMSVEEFVCKQVLEI